MPLIFLSLLLFQTIATTESGERVMLFKDGTWRSIEEEVTKEKAASNLVYIDVITSVSTFTGLYKNQGDDFNPSKTEIARDLAKHGIQTTMKEEGAGLIFRVEEKTWSIISPEGEILYYEQKPAIMWNNRIKDAANVIKQLLM